MKRILKLIVLIVLLFSFPNCKKSTSDLLYDRSYLEEIKKARHDMTFYLARNMIPGGTIAIAKGGKIIYSEGMGQASADLNVPVTRSTKFRIGNLSELFTSLMYHKMTEEGILHPDSLVQAYLPDFPAKQFGLPVRHLVQQTSGIREPVLKEQDDKAFNLTLRNGIKTFINDSLVAPPGSYQIPSFFNYNLLGVIMEEVTGNPFSTILEDYLTDTLDLQNTVVDNHFITIEGRTAFYDHNFIAQVVPAISRDLKYLAPSSGMLSNAEDLVKLGNAILFSDYISPTIRERLFEPVELNNKLNAGMTNSWILLRDREGRVLYGKTGSITGGTASIVIYPDEELVIACTTNLSMISEESPVFDIAAHFLTETQNSGTNTEQDEQQEQDEQE